MYYCNDYLLNLERIESSKSRLNYLRLDMNENPEGLPEEFVKRVLNEITPEYLAAYPETDKLLDILAKHYQLDREVLALTNGSDEAIRLVIETFTREGGKVITTSPTFAMYEVYCNMYGRIQEKIHYADNFKINTEDLIEKMDEQTDLLIIVNPDNPMGFQFNESELLRIVERAKEKKIYVLLDEAYVQFGKISYLSLIESFENIIVTRTFSKLFSLACCRLGVVLSSPRNIMLIKRAMSSYNVNGVAVKFAEKIIAENLEADLIQIQMEGKQYLQSNLQEAGYITRAAEGNFIFFQARMERDKLVSELEKRKILVKTYQCDILKNFIRVTTGSKEVMQKFINALKEIECEEAYCGRKS